MRLIKKWELYFADDRKRQKYFTFVERLLRDNVILRKITFGSRSDNGGE